MTTSVIDLPANCQATQDFETAAARLGKFIEQQVHRIMKTHDVGYEENDELQSHTYEDTVRQVHAALQKKQPVYVMKSAAQSGIYPEHIIWALRFWHEWLHATLPGADFSFTGECMVAAVHCDAVGAEFGFDSLEYKLMCIETYSQVLYYKIHGEFVVDQKAFALRELELL